MVMQKWLFTAAMFLVIGCNGITEVGNPVPTQATTANGATQALSASANTFVNAVGQESSLSALALRRERPSGFEQCTFSDTGGTKQRTCSCTSGSYTEAFAETFSQSGTVFNIDGQVSVHFDQCLVSSCGASVTLDGDMTGQVSGTIDDANSSVNLTIRHATSGACSGITADGTDIGFQLSMTDNGTSHDFSGTMCIGGTSFDFSDLQQLGNLLDPAGVCADGFGR